MMKQTSDTRYPKRKMRLTREEARALIADLTEEEKRMLAGLLAEIKKNREDLDGKTG